MADRTRRERLLTFLLLPAIVVAVVVLLVVTFQSSFQLEKLREQSVVEATLTLANEKADRLDKRIVDQDNAVLSLIDVTDRTGFGAEWLAVAARQTPTVRGVLLIDLSSQGREVVAFASRAPPLEAQAFRRQLVTSIFDELELGVEPRTQLRHLHKSDRDQSHLISYWQRDVGGRRYLLVAWHDVPRIVHDVFPALYSNEDGHSRVNVVDTDGKIIYGPPLSRGGFTLGKPFQTTLYKWRLNVMLLSAEELAEAVARRRLLEMMLVALSSLVVIAGITVVMVAAWRERKLSNLKSDFVANVSHELKTPLSLVKMFGELLHSGRALSDDKRQQYTQIIVTESERLGALIENVLDFARAERGKSAYEFQRVCFRDVVTRAVELCKVRAARDGVELVLELDDDLPDALADERAIELAIINLVDNALKYAPDGKQITVSAHRLPPAPALGASSERIEVRVTDRGPGIAPEDRKRIFERFVRGKNATETRVRGSGIGLALVKHIAEAHAGRAWVEGAPGGGSSFVFTLRAATAVVRARAVPEPAPAKSVAS